MLEFAPSVMSRLSDLVRNSGCTRQLRVVTPAGKLLQLEVGDSPLKYKSVQKSGGKITPRNEV